MDYLPMAAQGYQESGLDHERRSAVGAVGVMQVMPKTGAEQKVGDIKQLEPNIHADVKYIRYMVDHYYADGPMDDLNKGLFAFASTMPARVASGSFARRRPSAGSTPTNGSTTSRRSRPKALVARPLSPFRTSTRTILPTRWSSSS
jgi:hypothetical protein